MFSLIIPLVFIASTHIHSSTSMHPFIQSSFHSIYPYVLLRHPFYLSVHVSIYQLSLCIQHAMCLIRNPNHVLVKWPGVRKTKISPSSTVQYSPVKSAFANSLYIPTHFYLFLIPTHFYLFWISTHFYLFWIPTNFNLFW